MFHIKRLKNKKFVLPESSISALKSKEPIWLDVFAPSEKEIQQLAEVTKISINYFNEYLQKDSKPRTIEAGEYTFIVLNTIIAIENELKIKPLIIIISKHYNDFITIHNVQLDSITKLFNANEEILAPIFAKGPTSLFYNVTEEIINEYFSCMELIEDHIDNLEDEIFKNETINVMQKIHETKKALIYLHKSLIANRDVLSSIESEYAAHFTKEDLREFHLLYTDISQLIDLSLTYRDILSSTVEVYLSNISNNLNIVMKKLTAWAAIILVPALIAGVYGMNFKNMPELYWEYGYFFALGIMLFSLIFLILYFKKKDYI